MVNILVSVILKKTRRGAAWRENARFLYQTASGGCAIIDIAPRAASLLSSSHGARME